MNAYSQSENQDARPDEPQKRLNLLRLQKFQRFFQYGAVLLLTLVITLIIAGSFKLQKTNRNIKLNEHVLDSQQNVIRLNRTTLARQRDSIEALKNTSAALQTVTDSMIILHPELAGQVKNVLEGSITGHADGNLVQPRIYIQIAGSDLRAPATALAAALRAKGFVVPAIETMKKTFAQSDVRYRRSDAHAAADVALINQVVRGSGLPALSDAPFKPTLKVRARQYEIWLGSTAATQPVTPPVPVPANPADPHAGGTQAPGTQPVQQPTQQPKAPQYVAIIRESRFTGVNYLSEIRDDDKRTVVTVHVLEVARSMDQATMYITTTSDRTQEFVLKEGQLVVHYLNDRRYPGHNHGDPL